MNYLQIGELARKTGIPAQTIREYESQGLIQVEKTLGSPARYPARAVQQVRMVHSLFRQNYTVEKIRERVIWSSLPEPRTATIDLAQLSEQTGLSVAVLRNYVRFRLLEPLPSRSNQLVFSEAAVAQCQRVMTLRSHGLKAREIGALMTLFKFPASFDTITSELMAQRLQRVLVQKAVLEELELGIQDWFRRGATHPSPETPGGE